MSRFNSNSGKNSSLDDTIFKNPIATYSLMTTTYPTPSMGWTVRTIDDGKLYRYDSLLFTWVWIDTLNSSLYDELVLSMVANIDAGLFGNVDTEISIDAGNF